MTQGDFSRMLDRHEYINERCIEWAKYVRVTTRPFSQQPIFRNYRAPGRWDVDTVVPNTINTLDAMEIERAVSTLPDQSRTVLRWHYVWPALHPGAVARELRMSIDDLAIARNNALDYLIKAIAKKDCKADCSVL